MITLIISARTTPDRARAEAIHHLKTVHGPLVYDAGPDAGAMPSVYVQNHVDDDLPLPAALEPWRWDRHLVTEISFADIGDLKASTTTPYYLDTLKPDEPRFVDQTSVRPLVVQTTLLGHPQGAPWKLFVYLSATGDHQAFGQGWADACALVAPFCMAQALGLPIKAPGAPPPFADGVWSLWFQTADAARAFAVDHLEPTLALFGDRLDQAKGHVVLAQQFDVARLRAENAPLRVAS